MKIDKVKKQLGKINNLISSIEMDGEISMIEKDLLKSYVIELYERVALAEIQTSPVKQTKAHSKNQKKKSKKDTESIFSEDDSKVRVKTEALEKVVEKELQTVANGTSSTMDVDEVIDIKEEIEEEVKISSGQIDNDKMDYLFGIEKGNELSDKLSTLPIANLNKAIGLNDKIFTINELFKGNGGHFQEVMKELNGMSNFEEAKNYLLENVVSRYEWTDDSRIKKATNFIKIVHRRFL